jgi:hypothetical protein
MTDSTNPETKPAADTPQQTAQITDTTPKPLPIKPDIKPNVLLFNGQDLSAETRKNKLTE